MRDDDEDSRDQGPHDGYAMSFKEIAAALGITRQRASQIFRTAVRKANRVLAKRGYKKEDFING